jgi:hypothetical protein
MVDLSSFYGTQQSRCFPTLSHEEGNRSFPKRYVLYIPEYQGMDKVQKTNNSECYTPSAAPPKIYLSDLDWAKGTISE